MNRSEMILKMIVEYFIKTAEPVGSKTLIDEYNLDYSSATIRSEMNALEKEGFLEKTHTSSGRVPSKKGYEYYVSNLREERVDSSVKYAIAKVLDQKAQSVEEVIKQSCEILSNMTNLASVVLGPKVNEERLVSIQVIPIGNNTATAVFVTDQGYVENKTFMIDEKTHLDDVKKTVDLLNSRLSGTPISDVIPKMEAMRPALTDFVVGQDAVYQTLFKAFISFAGERMNLFGKERLLDQPEFADDGKKLRQLLALLDDPSALRNALETSKKSGSGDMSVKIGTPEQGLDDVSIVSAKLAIPGAQNASISLLGPKRMDYDRAISLLQYVSKQLDEYFSREKKGEKVQCQTKTKAKNPSKSKK